MFREIPKTGVQLSGKLAGRSQFKEAVISRITVRITAQHVGGARTETIGAAFFGKLPTC